MIHVTIVQGMPDDLVIINAPMLPDGSAIDWARVTCLLARQEAYGEPVPWHTIRLTNGPEISEEPPGQTTPCPTCGEPITLEHSGVRCSNPACDWWSCT